MEDKLDIAGGEILQIYAGNNKKMFNMLYGDCIEIKEPLRLREAVKAVVERMVKKYIK